MDGVKYKMNYWLNNGDGIELNHPDNSLEIKPLALKSLNINDALREGIETVSYTHLTLPTILRV